MYKQLRRLLKKHFPSEADPNDFQKLFDELSKAFYQLDEDRQMLERSLMLTSKELNAINSELRQRLVENKRTQELLKHQAFHDALTNLPNRVLLQEKLNHTIKVADEKNKKIALLYIDLDDFKKVNDTAGHVEGDRFLIEILNCIKKRLQRGNILGRLGGDEFLVILDDVSENLIHSTVKQILSIFENPFRLNDKEYFLSCCIGISKYPDDGDESEGLVRKANMAMYQAKREGKGQSYSFNEALETKANHRVSIESKLREALKENQLRLDFQPKIHLESNQIHGFEALIRWIRPGGSITYPDQFVDVAESTGLIRNLTLWVLNDACQRLVVWQTTLLKNLTLSINISAMDFSDPNFLTNVFTIIKKYPINPNLLEFELTETVFFNDIDVVKETLFKLKEFGIKLSIDDFGTGYSSFSYLQDLDIHYLKIDRSFVTDVHKSHRSRAIVKSIIDIGVNLGLEVIAEGVETQHELMCLKQMGCHMGQGYHFSSPILESALQPFVQKYSIEKKVY